uniref:lysozyme n=1 Tax=Sphaeramia orbicularis TaxID=375764 RepID=A0A672ZX16_9TELE
MKALVCLLLAVAVTDARRFTACEWARTLKANGMAGYRGVSLADWVCVTYHESRYNTAAVNHNSDGSKDYGIFQLNSHYWCSDGGESVANGCGITCDRQQVMSAECCALQKVSPKWSKCICDGTQLFMWVLPNVGLRFSPQNTSTDHRQLTFSQTHSTQLFPLYSAQTCKQNRR